MATNGATNGAHANGAGPSLTNYVAYRDPKALGQPRIGSLNFENSKIQPLAFASGHALSDLYQVIEVGESQISPLGEQISLSSVELLPPISGRDVLAVGKNYREHAVEFNTSGYDSSDKVDQPTHPVIFTKRATSIIASGEPILPHPEFTQTLDYEGEIGVILGKGTSGKPAFQVSESEALDYVWGYTIINDITARERQRDHKQFFIGKSPDTSCPMGPVAVPANKLPEVIQVQTFVNGEERQKATVQDLIFSVPFLIKTLSEGQTLQPGDVIATGTPVGVGFGQKPPTFLKPGDSVEIAVTGLGVLRNKIADNKAVNETIQRVSKESHVPIDNLNKTVGGVGLTNIQSNGLSKNLYYRKAGNASGPAVIFIHGLGGSTEYYSPLVTALSLESSHSLHLIDLEGHGLSPTSATSVITISSYAEDIAAIAQLSNVNNATVVAHSMGCHVAFTLALKHPQLVSKLILIGPPPSPLPEAAQKGSFARAATVRASGMSAVVDAVVGNGTSAKSKTDNLSGIAAARLSLLSQDPEGYAKGCTALGGSSQAIPVDQIKASTFIITGDEDKVSPPAICEKYASSIKGAKHAVLPNVGHWHLFEDPNGVAAEVKPYF